MREIKLTDAKASLSSLVGDAVRGEPSIITRNGKPEAVVIGYEEWERLTQVPSFGRLLMSAPFVMGTCRREAANQFEEVVWIECHHPQKRV